MSLITTGLLITLFTGCSLAQNLRTYNTDPSFSRWPNKAAVATIPYYFDSYYTPAEQGYVRVAIQAFKFYLPASCINFVETNATDTTYSFKVMFTPYNETGTLQTFCYSYPGQFNNLVNNQTKQQIVVLTRGQFGCLDGQPRSIMKYLAILVGKRNEHQRGDRDTYITMKQANILVPNSYRLFNSTEAFWTTFPYDYCSITHNQPTDYTTSGTVGFTVNSAPAAIPRLNQLSLQDCQIISLIYNCPATSCQKLDCAAARAAALAGDVGSTLSPATTPAAKTTPAPTTTITTPPTTTAPPTTTPSVCPLKNFCTVSPDESTYLLGPYQLYETLILFTGACALQYKYNFTSMQLYPFPTGQTAQPFSTYFPGPGGSTGKTPVSLAYMDLDPTTSGASFQLTMMNSASSALTCSTNPSFNVNPPAATCPNAASATNAAQFSKFTSATTQIFLGTYTIMQYAVLPSNTEIALTNNDLSVTYQTSTGFLTGQTNIAKITAIQIMQDENFFNDDLLAVFGVGSDGVTPYVGFVEMLLSASSALPLGPFSWLGTGPKLLSQSILGC